MRVGNRETPSWLRRHRRGTIVAAGALVAIVVAAATASWHFASEVLVPGSLTKNPEAIVEGLASGRVVLSRSEATERPGVYGLDWQAGHAIAGEVLSSNARTVTRRLCTEGSYMAAGLRVVVDTDVYTGTPRHALGLAYSNVLVPDELGAMPAWFVPGHTHTWTIFVHGINGNLEGGLSMLPILHRDGLPTLVISYRDDHGAPRSPDRLHHMGLTEWRDLAAAARYALSHGARRLILFGVSMGGAIVTQFMERSSLAGHVAGLVLEAPALSWKAILSFNASEMGLPSFAALPVEWAIGLRIDADWNAADALRHTDDFHLPILLVPTNRRASERVTGSRGVRDLSVAPKALQIRDCARARRQSCETARSRRSAAPDARRTRGRVG
jgi:pimeloyl-ACP methyl ester carboxylesterase